MSGGTAAPAAAPATNRFHGVMYGFYMIVTPLIAAIFLILPAVPLLLPFLPARSLRLKLYSKWVGLIMTVWLRLPTAILEARGMKVTFSGDYIPTANSERSSFLMISNHPSRIDWLVLWSWWARYGALDTQRIALKYGLKLIPGSGWAMQLASFLFLRRAWADDKRHMTRWTKTLFGADALAPNQVLLFPEGTNLTPETRGIDSKFVAKTPGLTEYTHVLHPRTTGFVHLVNEIRATTRAAETECANRTAQSYHPIDSVYDVTLAYPDGRWWTEMDLMSGRLPPSVHVHFKRYRLSQLPAADALAEWCNERFAEKEKQLALFRAEEPQSFTKVAESEGVTLPTPATNINSQNVGVWALWSAIAVFFIWLLCTSSLTRWYALLACVASFLFNKYNKDGFDGWLLHSIAPQNDPTPAEETAAAAAAAAATKKA